MSSISSVSAMVGAGATQSTQPQSSFRDLFKQLQQALDSGDLTGAQKASDALNQLIAKRQAAGGGNSSSPFAQGLSQVSSDLQSGNLQQAQADFASLQSAMSAQGGRGGASGAGGQHPHAKNAGGSSAATATPDVILSASLLSAIQDFLSSVESDLTAGQSTSSIDNTSGTSDSTSSATYTDNNLLQKLQSDLQSFLSSLESTLGAGASGAGGTSNPYTNNGSVASGLNSFSVQSFLNISA